MNLSNVNSWWFRVFVSASVLANVILGGEMYESLCARWWRIHNKCPDNRLVATIIWSMDKLEEGHCRIAHVYFKKIKRDMRNKEEGKCYGHK